ncbi:ATP-binding protein [Sulfurimonas sp. HSL-1656]|uniref:ATP-binding protein n=1 Tax=Thiomicrolovo subterrani TaxID=3131934 RepID=UPI0031F86A48
MQNNNLFDVSKEVFLDVVDANAYVQLDRVAIVYRSLMEAIKKPLKMILLFGKPGTGKSMMLSRIYKELHDRQKIVLYQTPITDEDAFFRSLARDVFDYITDEPIHFTRFNELAAQYTFETAPVILLDEAQMYSTALLEKIRLISDTRQIKFIISLHKTEQEDVIAKEHFQSRIWEAQELLNASAAELKIYIQKKLLRSNCFDVANMFNDKNVRWIHELTEGNYRNTNKLLFALFSIASWYEENQPTQINYTSINRKMIEMAGIETGFIHA